MNSQTQSTTANILVIDPLPAALRPLTDLLNRRGYRVQAVPDGNAGLSMARQMQPDLILLDVDLARSDTDDHQIGYEVCEQLKASDQTRDIPVIFITGAKSSLNIDRAFSVGGVDYLTKPLRSEEVLVRIETHLALQRRNYQLALLNRVGQDLTATLNLQRISEQIQEAVTEVVEAAGTSIWLVDRDDENKLVCQIAFHHGLEQYSSDLDVRVGQGVVGWVTQTGERVLVNDVTQDSRFFPGIDRQTGFQTHSLLAVPLRARDKVIGVLEVVNKLSGEFGTHDLILAETLAAYAAIAIDNTWLFEALAQHASELEASNAELQAALSEVKTLSGLLPICFNCKKIRDDAGYWQQIEIYVAEHSDAEFSHGLCTDCARELYPDIYQKSQERRQEILDTLAERGALPLATIAAVVGQPESNTLNRLQDMVKEGLIRAQEVEGQTLYKLDDA